MGGGAGTGGSVEEPDCWPVLPPHAANANDEHTKRANVFAVCDLIFIFFRTGKWGTRFTSPRAGRLEDAIKLLPEPARCGQSRWPIDCNARLGKTTTRPTRRHERLSGLIHLNWLTIFKSGVRGRQPARDVKPNLLSLPFGIGTNNPASARPSYPSRLKRCPDGDAAAKSWLDLPAWEMKGRLEVAICRILADASNSDGIIAVKITAY